MEAFELYNKNVDSLKKSGISCPNKRLSVFQIRPASWISQTQATIRVGADKSLARPTSRCRRAESIVSLERGVCSCAELQVFSCYRG